MWEFETEVSDANRERFGRYASYIHSIDYDETDVYRGHEARPSDRVVANMFLRHPTSNASLFPKLNRVNWIVVGEEALMHLLVFLVPTLTTLQIGCWGALEGACAEVLKALAPRRILLTALQIAMSTHDQAFLESLSDTLANQRRLIEVCLPHYTASRQVVAALAALPSLEEYGSWTFVDYQVPLAFGMEFDWKEGAFMALKTFKLMAPLAHAANVMSRPHQPRLDDLTIISRDFLEHSHLRQLCSSISTTQPNLTKLRLCIYSETVGRDPSHAIPFSLILPLLLCTALQEFRIRSDLAIAFNDEDIANMASAWPELQHLGLCGDPASDVGLVTGQPLRSVGTFVQSFCVLQELSLYLNTSDTDMIPGISTRSPPSRLCILDFGTSPIPTNNTNSGGLTKVEYVASLLAPHAEIKGERSHGHTRFLPASGAAEAEYSRRERFWSGFAAEVHIILSGTTGIAEEIMEPLCGSPERSSETPSAQSSCEQGSSLSQSLMVLNLVSSYLWSN
ncbi:hypothetical protein FRB96_003969 [Tulasnella sp. 330]|nr:hypothetical protein FRB96_003969 [Tulasnella sp. 330]KAG8875343.1 hypothetical protein FRB97_005207 [Tulasnella sp. 331]KAG8880293.1 hypothetical protein FRB98_005206 [Tulasnella sp. 332]